MPATWTPDLSKDLLNVWTKPAPPGPENGTKTVPKPYAPSSSLRVRLQRATSSKTSVNAIAPSPGGVADWVMEEEIPAAPGTFLQYATRRCFQEDWLQIRVQLHNVKLKGGKAWCAIHLLNEGYITDDEAVFIASEQPVVDAKTGGCWFKEARPLTASGDITAASQADRRTKILYQTVAAQPANSIPEITYLLTEIRLPAHPTDMDTRHMNYICKIRLTDDDGKIVDMQPPKLRVMRWWADPAENLQQPKTHADNITPLVDGEAYFAWCAAKIKAATQTICIANWSFHCDTSLTGQPGAFNDILSDLLLERAKAGVKVYILLDYFNASWAIQMLKHPAVSPDPGYDGDQDRVLYDSTTVYTIEREALINRNNPSDGGPASPGHANIYVKTHTHGYKVMGNQVGSYHEKFLIVDGMKAAVGGMDFEPDRYQDGAHDWKCDVQTYGEMSRKRLGYNRLGGFMLWHDAAVGVEGDVVQNLEHDFFTRWNDAEKPNQVSTIKPLKQTADVTTHNAQIVKTSDKKGTFDAYKQAIYEARHYIYIENQYFTYPALADELCNALEKNPGLQLMVVIPYFTEEAASLGDKKYESQTVMGALYHKLKGDLDTAEIKDRGVRHQEWLLAKMITRLRATSRADERVGIYAMAGHTQDRRSDRTYTLVTQDHKGTAEPNTPLTTWLNSVETHVTSGADGKFNLIVPANSKNASWQYQLDEHYAYRETPGTHIDYVVRNVQRQAVDGAPYRVIHYGVVAAKGVSDAGGKVDITIPTTIRDAILRYGGFDLPLAAGDHHDAVLLDLLSNPMPAGTAYELIYNGVVAQDAVTGADGKVVFTVPADIAYADFEYDITNLYYEVLDVGAEMIYPHSKTMVVDDTWAIIGSANANGKSMVVDAEMNVVIHDREAVTKYRKQLWKEHLGLDLETRDIRTFFDKWNATTLPAKKSAEECDPAQVNGVHAVKYGTPPEGQEYNGPGSAFVNMGDQV